MVRTLIWTLRQRRYATIAAAMFLVAIGCVIAGTWQIQRFAESVRDNHALDRNARAATVPLSAAGVPLAPDGKAPGRDAIRFRTVTTSGTYIASTAYLSGKVVSGNGGYYVVSPLRTPDGIVLVIRGFVNDVSGHPAAVPAVPSGRVVVTGRLDTVSNAAGGNPSTQARALGSPVYQATLKLLPSQPGGAGLVALPKPDLSNPAGGAYEAQHFAYIVQWYIFAVIALAAPFLLARNEVRDAQRRFLGVDTGDIELGAGDEPGSDATGGPGTELVTRPDGSVVRAGVNRSAELARAKRLADRYGRSLSLGTDAPAARRPSRRRTPMPVGGLREPMPSSSEVPHRSHDDYQGSYNDYLWQLGLADGDAAAPEIASPDAPLIARPATPGTIEAVVIDVEAEDTSD